MKLFLAISIFSFSFHIICAQPDTTQSRKATPVDAAYWPSVNAGDYIFFPGTRNAIYSNKNVRLNEGYKILIWRGNYERIYIDGTYCYSSKENPTIITNLGGQVKWGYSERNAGDRTLELKNFHHVYLTGKYDSLAQTGHPDYLGHNEGKNLGNGNYHEKYGMWGNPRWSGVRFYSGGSNIVRISKFSTCKVSYVAATEGGFAGFNIKTDNPVQPKRVEVDIHDCFAGWTESEGVYISWSTGAEKQDLTKLTLRNNIFAFTGTEALQTDNLTEGSVIENNVVFVSACFHRRPFQDLYQDGLHQFSFVEGGVIVKNNIMLTGSNCHQIRYKDPGTGRAFPSADKPVLITNNFYGYSRSDISYIWEGDGITPYNIENNVYGPVYTPAKRDAYKNVETYPAFVRICNQKTNITYRDNIYPPGRQFLKIACYISQLTDENNNAEIAPLLRFENSGFSDSVDYRDFTIYSPFYQTRDKYGTNIYYKEGDIVFLYDENGVTRFYQCISAHSGDFSPLTSEDKWQLLTWNGSYKPPLDIRLKEDSYYNNRKMGLNFSSKTTSLNSYKLNKPGFTIFPNPADRYLSVSSVNNQAFDYSLYKTDGTCVIRKKPVKNSHKKINISGLQSGVYVLILEIDNSMTAQFKIVKT